MHYSSNHYISDPDNTIFSECIKIWKFSLHPPYSKRHINHLLSIKTILNVRPALFGARFFLLRFLLASAHALLSEPKLGLVFLVSELFRIRGQPVHHPGQETTQSWCCAIQPNIARKTLCVSVWMRRYVNIF